MYNILIVSSMNVLFNVQNMSPKKSPRSFGGGRDSPDAGYDSGRYVHLLYIYI